MIIRDIIFYLVGYIFGVKGMTIQGCLKLYKSIIVENKIMQEVRAN